MTKTDDDLGFSFSNAKSGDVQIFRHGQRVTILRNNKAVRFIAKMNNSGFGAQQHTMARLTGNYRRGNERAAKNHPRNLK